jgi:hypothetical protein
MSGVALMAGIDISRRISRSDRRKMTARPAFDPLRSLLAELGPRRRAAAGAWPQPVINRPAAPAAPRRTKLWELGGTLHCSIIGTCLTTAELRRALEKANLVQLGATEHDLHGQGVSLASKQGQPAKLLHKALDERHRLTIKRFEAARSEEEVRRLWQEARRQGEIPGAYWAVVTHAAATAGLVREVFGEVHMLSHLVGAANRADIRRLGELEAERDSLSAKVVRQEAQLRRAIGERDARIEELTRLLAARPSSPGSGEADGPLAEVIADLQRKLEREQARRVTADERSSSARAALADEAVRREQAERLALRLAEEIEAFEGSLTEAQADEAGPEDRLGGLAVLYVGGHQARVGHLRSAAHRLGATLSHHDGGVGERPGLLAGLVSRADLVLFPVDCVSHDAALAVKRLCRQAGKPYLPLRSAGLASFVAALRRRGTGALDADAAAS